MRTNCHEKLFAGEREVPDFTLRKGDCGLIIRANGHIDLFGDNHISKGSDEPVDKPVEKDEQLARNAETLTALCVVAASPDLQSTILSTMISAGAIEIETANSR